MEPQVADIAGFIEWLILLLTEETGLNFFISLIYRCKVRIKYQLISIYFLTLSQ
jgi:hypothetical protein